MDFIIIGLALIIICVLITLITNKQKTKSAYSYSRKNQIMTKSEQEFFNKLNNYFGSNLYVFPQVHLTTFLEHKIKNQKWKAAFYHINGKSVDYLLCRKDDLRPICAIELDDYTHNRSDRVERDREIERIFANAKFPLVRIKDYKNLTAKKMYEIFLEAINQTLR